jgi:hypothetical protein
MAPSKIEDYTSISVAVNPPFRLNDPSLLKSTAFIAGSWIASENIEVFSVHGQYH